MKKNLLIALLVLPLSGCAEWKPIAKTVVEVARGACSLFAEEQGLSFKDVCETEEQLRPFVDSILSAKQIAAAKRMGIAAPAPDCSAQTPAPAPSAVPTSSPK